MTALHDVADVEDFARTGVAAMSRHLLHGRLTPDEWEELQAEGVALLYALARTYRGERSFAGYAATYLPRRLLDAYNRLTPERQELARCLRRQRDARRRVREATA